MYLDPGESQLIEVASHALNRLPAGASAAGIFDAIRPCISWAAGLFSIIRPSAPDASVSHAVHIPPDVFESWLGTPREQGERALAPMVKSAAGSLWSDSETLKGAQREKFKVLRKLDEANLGEGAGYKILERSSPLHGGAEHFMLALLMERGQAVPPRSRVMLAALNPTIRDTVLRLSLPFVGREKMQAQITAERSQGYVCVSLHGPLLEANRRAYDLVTRYQGAARIQGRRRAVTEFAARARKETSGGQMWILPASKPESWLQVSTHRLFKEGSDLPEDVILVVMEEVLVPRSPAEEPAWLEPPTPKELEIVHLLVTTGDSEKQMAAKLGITVATVTKHMENLRRKAQCHSRPELTLRLKRWGFT